MKNYFKIGLMALTLAFGVTSCDKQDNGGSAVNALSLEAQGLASKVTFSENGGIAAPKGFKNLTAKNAADFANSHIYATTPQTLVITGDLGDYSGSYTAGDISNLEPSSIILPNGSYTALSSNISNDVDDLVTGFASYRSNATFDLSVSSSIQLNVTHERGFVIADSQRAEGGTRITSVVLSLEGASGNLILDESDEFRDFYGYLRAGTYGVVINYTLNNLPATKSGSVVIANGVASTLAPILTAEATVSSVTESDVETVTESDLTGDDLTAYSNNDADFVDVISRVVSSTVITTGGVPADATFEYGTWEIVTDNVDANIVEDSSIGDDSTDTTAPIVTVTSNIPAEGGEIGVEYTFTAESSEDGSIVWSKGDNAQDNDALVFTTSFANAGDKVVSVSVVDAASNLGETSISFTINAAEVVEDPIDTYTYTDFSGTAPIASVSSGTAVVTTATAGSNVEFVVQTTTTPQFSTVAAYQLTREATIVQNGDLDSPAPATEALTQDVAEDVTTLTALVATEDVMNIAYVAPNEAAVWVNTDGVWSNSDFASYTFTIDEDPLFQTFGYILSTDGVAANAITGEHTSADLAIAAAQAAIALL